MNEKRGKEKAPSVAAPGALDNVVTYEENNVMAYNSTIPESASNPATANVIPFRSKELLLVDNDGSPFVPMKPVVEGMGLAWQTQHRKMMGGRFASTITIMVIVAQDGKPREMACLPLRKLPGWLMSIHASKVRPELRDNVIAFQNECDDVLWSYWNEGIAVRKHNRDAASVLSTTIGTDGFHCLAAVLDGKVRHLPAPARKRAKQHVWSQVHKAFSVVSAQDIPSDQMDGARNFIAAYAIEGEWLGKEEPAAPKPQRLDIHCPVSELVEKRPDMMRVRSGITDTLDVNLQDFMKLSVTPCEQILHTLCNAGYEIEAAWFEIRTYRNKLYDLESCIRGLSYSFGSDQQYVIDGRRPQQTA